EDHLFLTDLWLAWVNFRRNFGMMKFAKPGRSLFQMKPIRFQPVGRRNLPAVLVESFWNTSGKRISGVWNKKSWVRGLSNNPGLRWIARMPWMKQRGPSRH